MLVILEYFFESLGGRPAPPELVLKRIVIFAIRIIASLTIKKNIGGCTPSHVLWRLNAPLILHVHVHV